MTIRFEPVVLGDSRDRTLVYRTDDYSFDVEPPLEDSFTSVLINELSLEIDETGNLLSVWGFCPHTGWKNGHVRPPASWRGAVRVRSDTQFHRGVSISLLGKNRWSVLYEEASGWLVMGDPGSAETIVEPVIGAVLGISNTGELSALWLKAGSCR